MNFNQNKNTLYSKHYQKIVCTDIIYKQKIKNVLSIFKLEKIVLNTMNKNAIVYKKYILYTMAALNIYSMQKPKYICAYKSINNFKLRKNTVIATKVDLRNKKMYYFLEKLMYIIVPKIKMFNKINVNIFQKLHSLNININLLYNYPELENYFEYFLHSQNVNIILVVNTKQKKKYMYKNKMKNIIHYNKKVYIFLTAFKIPLHI